ncbi:MAG: flagellar hook-length control protein FliK [Armatimonadetes bacterium]|nr:flagellar hook-length control protein FliK [Armatimonadota bacterium]
MNLRTVGAAPEAHLGDAPVATAPPSEGTDFAGVLEAMLPADALPVSEEAVSPNADALQAQMATLGLPLLTLLPVQTPAVADRAVEPSLQPAPSEDALQLLAGALALQEPTTAQCETPEPTPALGDGMGDFALTEPRPETPENLLAVEGNAPPAAARQVEPPPPPPSTTGLTDASALGAPSTAPAQDAPLRDDLAPPPEALRPHEESPTPAPAHEPRPHAPTPHAPPPTHETTHSATDAAAPVAEPNWNAAEQVAQHIERMVYERERNRLTVRLDPPELGVVELRIQATGGEVQAWLTAERDLTRQMLQQAQQYLREQLESRGLHLTHFDVGAQSQFHHAPREQHTRYAAQTISTRTPTATDSLLYDGRWSVWV